MTVFKQARGWFRRYRRDAAGNVSVTFTLFLIPLCGLLAMAIGMGNGVLMQRTEQHAADSAALAAATGGNTNCYDSSGNTSASVSMSTSGATAGKCVTTSSGTLNAAYTPGYQLEAKAVAASFTQISGATVTPAMDYCPGTTSGSYDCYKVTISRTAPLYFGSVVGISNMQPTAVAYATAGVQHDDCFVGTGYDTSSSRVNPPASVNDAIYLNGNNDLGSCWAAVGSGKVDCSGSVRFAGVLSPSSSSCGAGYQKASYSDAARESAVSALVNALPKTAMEQNSHCSSDINALNWVDGSSVGGTAGVQYAVLSSGKCNGANATVVMSADRNLSTTTTTASRILILDGVGIDINGHNLIGASSAGTTIVATASSGTVVGQKFSGSQDIFYNSGGSNSGGVDIRAPVTGTFANYAIIGDPAYTGASRLDDSSNNKEVNFSILGIVFVPYSDVFLDASNNSYFNSIGTCMSIVGNTIQGNGGKLSAALTASCASLGYVTPTSLFAIVALVK
jgi:Flp pilus assembly protein TadG